MMINKTIGTERPFGEGSLPYAANKHDLALSYIYCMLKTSSHRVWVVSVMVVIHDCEFLNIIEGRARVTSIHHWRAMGGVDARQSGWGEYRGLVLRSTDGGGGGGDGVWKYLKGDNDLFILLQTTS